MQDAASSPSPPPSPPPSSHTFRKEYIGNSRIRRSGRLYEASAKAAESIDTAWELYQSAIQWGSALLPALGSTSASTASTTNNNNHDNSNDADEVMFGTASASARAAFRSACACIDDNVRLFDRALRNFDMAIREDAEFVDARLGRAKLHLRMRRFDHAIADFRLCLALCRRRGDVPRTIEALHGRALALVAQNALERAENDLNDALELDPQHLDVLLLRADVLARLERGEDALVDVKHALETCSEAQRPLARSALAGVLSSVGKHVQAVKEATKACENAVDAAPFTRLAAVLLASGNGREAEALQAANAAVERGATGEALVQRAKVRLALAFDEDALEDLNAALRGGDDGKPPPPPDPAWLHLRSRCFARLGRDEDAIADRVAALRIDGDASLAIAAFEREARRAMKLARKAAAAAGDEDDDGDEV